MVSSSRATRAPRGRRWCDDRSRRRPPQIETLETMQNALPILIADAPEALTGLCGVNLLERLLRILQRLGFRRAIVFSGTPDVIGAELARRSWARKEISAELVPGAAKPPLTARLFLEHGEADRFLIVP